eukprot:916664-Rhodomonas_salina.1
MMASSPAAQTSLPSTLSSQQTELVRRSPATNSPVNLKRRDIDEATGYKVSTVLSKMFKTTVPEEINVVMGVEVANSQFGNWVKLWLKAKEGQTLFNYKCCGQGMPDLHSYDPRYPMYIGVHVPSELCLQLYKDNCLRLANAESHKISDQTQDFTWPRQCTAKAIFRHCSHGFWNVSGATQFLYSVYNDRLSVSIANHLVQWRDGSYECDNDTKQRFNQIAREFELDIEVVMNLDQ